MPDPPRLLNDVRAGSGVTGDTAAVIVGAWQTWRPEGAGELCQRFRQSVNSSRLRSDVPERVVRAWPRLGHDEVMAPAMVMGLARVNGWMIARPVAGVVLSLIAVFPLVMAGFVAVTSHASGVAIPGLVAGVVGGFVGAWRVNHGGWDLDRKGRMAVWDATVDGRSTGEPRLDAIAAYQLEGASRSYPADRMFISVIVALAVAVPIVAAARTGQSWWLWCELSAVLLGCGLLPALFLELPQIRLRRLTESPPPGSSDSM